MASSTAQWQLGYYVLDQGSKGCRFVMGGRRSESTLEEILAIPGNQAVYDLLKTLLRDGSAMAFVGAGASFPLYPLWGQLIAQLAHEPVRLGLASEADEQHWLRTAGSKPLQVASQIRARLGDPLYHTFLFETFKDRTGPGGRAYTPAHAALMRSNFKACLTTNYDPGLLEARRQLRPEIHDTGFTVWNQNFAVNRWASGDLFKSGAQCPVLFAHGHFDDPAGIVLDHGSYRQAYHNTPYRRLFENLWFQERLVFVGFSFNDVTLAQIADEVLWQTARQGGGQPRHVTIIGLPDDQPYTPEMRREYLEGYDAEVLFYPVTEAGHSALQVVLESLATLEVPAPAPLPPPAARPVPARFVHETTEDEKFTGRTDALARLDRWAADPSVRLIAITAIGGLGKTALIGRWLRQARPCEGVLFWSFYRDREAQRFFEALLAFGREQLDWKPRDEKAAPRVQACELLESRRLMVALDGLEVIQEVPGTVAYGKLLEIELAEFLHCHCRAQGGSLVLLTSRFPFPDLTPYLGRELRSLPLPALEPEEGADLLAALGLGGQAADRGEISRRLFGHPLALRLFARSVPPHMLGDPTRLWQTVFDQPHLAADDSLDGKVRRLLAFYEARLSEAQCQVLALVALFRAPVGEATLAPLWEKLLGKPSADASLREALNQLRHEHLLSDDPGEDGKPRYACHPILRDHFRGRLLGQPGFAREAAGMLAGPPDAPRMRSLEGIHVVAAAIEVLLEADELKAADDLYFSRLERGELFKWLPAPHWGMEVARGFVRDETRRQALAQQLGPRRLGFYLNAVALFADLAGEPATALEFYTEGTALDRKENDSKDLSIGLQNLGSTEVSLGLLAQAASHFAEAFDLAEGIDEEEEKLHGLAHTAYTASLRGDVERADADFSQANAIENRIDKADLYSVWGIRWAEHLLRRGAVERARQLTEANRKICERNRWQADVARCQWILGWLDTLAGRWTDAHGHLDRAKVTFTAGHMIYELARVFVTESACFLGQGQCESALAACERALQLAAPRNYRLVHAEALNLRAQVALESAAPDPACARDDAEAALQLAEFCEYAWAQRDALELLARAHHQLGNPTEALRCRERAVDWNRRLKRG